MKRTPLESWVMTGKGIDDPSRQALEDYQLKKLRATITYAKKSGRFYGEYLKDINEVEIHSIHDFQRLPFTSPEHVRDNSLHFLCVPQPTVNRIVTLNTTGTTGDNKRIYFSEEDMESNLEFFKVGMSCLVDEKDKVLVLLPGSAYGTIGDFLKRALEQMNIHCYVEGVLKNIDETEKLIKLENITCIVGIPTQVLYFSRTKPDIFKKYIKKLLLSTDYVPSALVKELTDEYGCSVFNHYGMTEMGYGAAVECEALDGYHLRELDLYFEIVDPESGEPVKDGEIGEVVFSTINRTAMPLIRYRTGDLASFKVEKCSCGTFLRTMNRVLGRINNRIEILNGEYLYLSELDELVFKHKSVLDYKAKMTENGLVVEILIKDNYDTEYVKLKVKNEIEKYLNEKNKVELSVQVIEKSGNKPDEIINSMMKRKIIDYRKA